MLAVAKAEAESGEAKPIRDLAIVRSLHDLGLRRGEVVELDVEHVDLDRGSLGVLGKGQTERKKLTLPEPTRASLGRWLEIRSHQQGALFVRLDRAAVTPSRLTGEAVQLLVADLAHRAGVSGPVRPHGLRHIAVTEVLDRNGGDIRAAQEFARHADPKTTMRYDRNRRDMAGAMAKLIADD
jgi:site-specific recombinase XerC